MSMKVEVDEIDANIIACLKKATGIYSVLNWDSSLSRDVTIKIEIKYPPTGSVPVGVIDAVNECVAKCARAFFSSVKEFPCSVCRCVPCDCSTQGKETKP